MRLIQGDCLKVLAEVAENSIDSIVTDPPYGLAFMGKQWDYSVPSVEVWQECLRVLKPGGHLLAFAGTRTQHRMAVNIEDAGFEIRDMVAWVYGQGFPKSLDVSKAIDKQAGVKGEVVGERRFGKTSTGQNSGWNKNAVAASGRQSITAPVTNAARQWQGWGTALKPALEPVTVARKPLTGTVAENVQTWGTGALNIDGCRAEGSIEYASGGFPERSNRPPRDGRQEPLGKVFARSGKTLEMKSVSGRWPANLIHDGSDEVVGLFPETKSEIRNPSGGKIYGRNALNESTTVDTTVRGFSDSGSAARFFYCAKASKNERGEGNTHPTVKPVALMRYLCRLVTPPRGTVLDPFMGSGTTGIAAKAEGFSFIGIEKEAAYFEIAKARIEQNTNTDERLSDEG